MPLSSNTVIHFTSTKENLKNILRDNFHIFYCKETVYFTKGAVESMVPMVSFCDIPLSEIKSHISKYGSYGIGMTRTWAIQNRLNPVLYVSGGSNLCESYRQAFIGLVHSREELKSDWSDQEKAIVDLIRYTKSYEGGLMRNNRLIPNYRFSDEREWRYVPPFNTDCEMITTPEYYKDNKERIDKLIEPLRLTFEPNDIKYVIIDKDSEIKEFVDHLKETKGHKFTYADVERLTTRILTAEQIREDV